SSYPEFRTSILGFGLGQSSATSAFRLARLGPYFCQCSSQFWLVVLFKRVHHLHGLNWKAQSLTDRVHALYLPCGYIPPKCRCASPVNGLWRALARACLNRQLERDHALLHV